VLGSSVLDVVVGLGFLYFLLATIVTYVNEVIAALLKRRTTLLANGIRSLLGSEWADRVLSHEVIAPLRTASGGLAYIPSRLFSTALLDELRRAGMQDGEDPPLEAPAAIKALFRTYGPSVQVRATAIEAWYEAGMDRLSGEYKRRTQLILLGLSALLTLVIGADSIGIATTLWQEQGVRTALNASLSSSSASQDLTAVIDALARLPLPLGWGTLPATPTAWLVKALGLVITAAAVALGAPFWFDLLTSIGVNPRVTGPKPGTESAAPQAPVPPGP
jgi:hypothetical protein